MIVRQEQRTQHRIRRIDNLKLHLTNMLLIAVKPFTFCQTLALLLALSASARSETRTETYKTTDGVKLNLTIQLPDGWKADDKRSAIIFFFGGGWTSGSTQQIQ